MIIWLAMFIPLISAFLAYKFWNKQFVFWELLLPVAACFVFILITKFSVEKTMLSDTQYRGGLIVEARYYEYWSTYVEKTCYRNGSCIAKDKQGNCTEYEQVPYDCSYCDEHQPYWQAFDDQGNDWIITEAEYKRLMRQWNATPEKVDMNRSINQDGSCGVDGDMYKIKWNGDMLSSESSTWPTRYDNHVQCSKSVFDLTEVSEDDAKKWHLYEYPEIDNFKQKNILGLDSITFLEQKYKNGANKMFEYFNGVNGPKRKLRIYLLMFYNQPMDMGIRQKNYWVGGNKNEVNICIDVDRNTGKINWVYPFTWGENKRISVDLREDIMNMDTLNFTGLYHIVDKATEGFTYRDFTQFNYLSVDPPTWEIWVVYILTIAITIGVLYYGYKNEFENE